MNPIDLCFHWVRERESVRIKKDGGIPHPWTKDEILGIYRFCNVRREDDRVTIWIRDNIREPFADHEHLWFMLCIARQINWPGSLATLIGEECWPSNPNFSPKALGDELERMAESNYKVFTGAYNITAPPVKGMKKTHFVAEHTLGNVWKERDRFEIYFQQGVKSLKRVHSMLTHFDCWGPFMAYQAVVDMRFTDLLSDAVDIETWAAAGPGTIRGLNRIAGRELNKQITQDQALFELRQLAPLIRKETGVEFDFSDVPNIMCETDKYIRVRNGEGKPRALYVPGRGS